MRRSGNGGGEDARKILANKLASDAFTDIRDEMSEFLKYYERTTAAAGKKPTYRAAAIALQRDKAKHK